MSEVMDPSKMKVAELRAELQDRGLDTKGNKPVLVERLKEALDAEGGGKESSMEEKKDAEVEEEEEEEESAPEPEESTPDPEPETAPSPQKSPVKAAAPAPSPQKSPVKAAEPAPSPQKSPVKAAAPSPSPQKSPVKAAAPAPSPQKSPVKAAEPAPSPQKSPVKPNMPAPSPVKPTMPAPSPQKSPVKPAGPAPSPQKAPVRTPTPSPQKSPIKSAEPTPRKKGTEAEVSDTNTAFKEEPMDSKTGYEDTPTEMDVKQEPGNGEIKEEVDVKQEELEVKQEVDDAVVPKRGEKRQLSRSRSPEAKRSRPEVEELRVEDEPEVDKTLVTLDWYNSDLSMVINKDDFLSAQPLTMQGFGYVWHGVRATYGFTRGRIFYQARADDYLPVPQLEEEEQHPHVLRVGWSINDAGLTLGEDPLSYGYGGTAKASTNLRFKDYGKKFGKGDIVGCYLDLESEPIVMAFTINGVHQGIAYEIHHAELGDNALFPHIVTKNTSFKVNFGAEDPWTAPLTGYTFVGDIPLEDRVLGGDGPERRDESEVIMMVGLPAAGKTTWVENYCRDNLYKKYNVLGTNSLIDKMKVNGLPRRRNYAGRWEVLIERCTKCLNKLLELGYKRRRNFIVDQTNVYPSAQRRKMKGFAGFKRRAVVICPSDEDLKKRTDKREKEEGKDVPDKAVLEMKANYKLPDDGELFDSVEFIELTQEESLKLVEQYNKEGEEAGFGQKKGFRGSTPYRRGGFMDRREGFGNRGGSFRGGWDRDRRGSFTDRRDRGSWNRDRDTRDYNRGGYTREVRGAGTSSGSYTRDYNSRGSYSRDSRGSGYNRDRGSRSSYQSSWNKGASTETKASTNPWATTQQGAQQGSYSGYSGYAGSQWAGQGSYSYNQGGYGSGGWNQQYYGQQQAASTPATQTQQPYWNTGYGYGQGYGTGQSYASSATSSTGSTSSSWGQPSSWSGTGQQQQWGSSYGRSQYGSGSSSYSSSSSSQRR